MHNFNTTTLGAHGEGFKFITYELIVWKKTVSDVIKRTIQETIKTILEWI